MGSIPKKTNEWLILTAFVIVLVIHFILNCTNQNFWYDETMQFWISYGRNPFSPLVEGMGGFSDVIKYNADWNMDPGGFSILLHYWLLVSKSVIWLRLLPFLFFLLTLIFCFKYFLKITDGDRRSALMGVLFVLFVYPWAQYGFELRAYGMEVCGVIVLLYYRECFVRDSNGWNSLLKLSLSMAFFITSRYSFAIVACSFCILLYFDFIKKISREKLIIIIRNTFLVSIPALLSLVFIVKFSLLPYFGKMKGAVLPAYVQENLINGNDLAVVLKLVRENTLSKFAVIPIMLLFLRLVLVKKQFVFTKSLDFYISFYFLCYSLFLLLSLAGIHVWNINSRWNLQLLFLSSLSVPFIFLIGNEYLKRYYPVRYVLPLMLLVLVSASFVLLKGGGYREKTNILSSIQKEVLGKQIKSRPLVLVDAYNSPTYKYLLYFGGLQNDREILSLTNYLPYPMEPACADSTYDFIITQARLDSCPKYLRVDAEFGQNIYLIKSVVK